MFKKRRKKKIDFEVHRGKLPGEYEYMKALNESELLDLIESELDRETKEAWYDDIVRWGKCDVCEKVKPLQWDTNEGHFCHNCLINSKRGFEVFLDYMGKLFPEEN